MANYIDPDELKREIELSKDNGSPTERFFDMASLIFQNINAKYKFKLIEPEDIQQDLFIHLAKALPKLDTDRTGKDLFNYVTTLVFNLMRHGFRAGRRNIELKKSFERDKLNAIYKDAGRSNRWRM